MLSRSSAFLPFIVWEPLAPAQEGQELVPGQSNTGVWGKAGPLSTQTRPPGSQAQLPGPQSEQGSRFRICRCLEFSGLHVFCQARAQLCLPATWLHGTAFAPDLRHAEGKEYYIRFFLKVMDKITTPVAENWDPYQVSMKEIMTETKDKCSALFRASENFPWYGSAARVGSDNYSLDTHTLFLEGTVYSLYTSKCFPAPHLLRASEQTCEEGGAGVIVFLWRRRQQVHKGKIICSQPQRWGRNLRCHLPFWGVYLFKSSEVRPKIILPRVWL